MGVDESDLEEQEDGIYETTDNLMDAKEKSGETRVQVKRKGCVYRRFDRELRELKIFKKRRQAYNRKPNIFSIKVEKLIRKRCYW